MARRATPSPPPPPALPLGARAGDRLQDSMTVGSGVVQVVREWDGTYRVEAWRASDGEWRIYIGGIRRDRLGAALEMQRLICERLVG